MKGDLLPPTDHITRLCQPATAPNGKIQATAFMLKHGEESLSVNWLEYLKCSSRENEINEIRRLYAAKFSRVGAGARIAVLNVGGVCQEIRENSDDGRVLRITHDPEDEISGFSKIPDLSHSGIYNLRDEEDFIAELICGCILEHHTART
jgi:hypothetical protein